MVGNSLIFKKFIVNIMMNDRMNYFKLRNKFECLILLFIFSLVVEVLFRVMGQKNKGYLQRKGCCVILFILRDDIVLYIEYFLGMY